MNRGEDWNENSRPSVMNIIVLKQIFVGPYGNMIFQIVRRSYHPIPQLKDGTPIIILTLRKGTIGCILSRTRCTLDSL